MTTFLTLAFLAILCLTLLLAAASYLSRGAVRRGLFILFMALGLSATSVLTIYPALRLTQGGQDDAYREAEMENLRIERDRLLAEVNQKSRDNEALSKTSAFFSKLNKERLNRISDELQNVRDLILGPGNGLVLGNSVDVTETSVTGFLAEAGGYDAILTDLKRLKSLRPRTPDDAVEPTLVVMNQRYLGGVSGQIVDGPLPDGGAKPVKVEDAALEITRKLNGVKAILESKASTASYKIEPLPDTDLVAGRNGRYYSIELHKPADGERFTFDSAKYTFASSRAAYKSAFNALAGDVLINLEGKVKYDLFVRGSADGQAYTGVLEPGFEYRKISYLPSTPRGKYLSNLASIAVGGTVKNSDLPNLRAEYLRGYISELYPVKSPLILEGAVTKKGNPAARNAELILFVAWDAN
jgi:hypothetical protein